MEISTGIAEHGKLGENNASSSEVMEQPVKENVTLSVDASKDSDGHEVFEEAAEADPPNVGQEGTPKTKDESSALSGALEKNEDNSNLFHEVHEFEEAIVAPGAIQSSEDSWKESEILKGVENLGDKVVGMQNIMMDETNGLLDDDITDNNDRDNEDVINDYRGIVDQPGTAGETKNQEHQYENYNGSNENLEDNILGKLSFLEALTSGGAKSLGTDNVGEPIVDKSQCLDPNEPSRPETVSEKFDVETFSRESVESRNGDILEGDDTCSDIPEHGILNHVNLIENPLNHEDIKNAGTVSNAPKEQIHETFQEIEDAHCVKETGAHLPLEADLNGDGLHKTDPNAVSISGYKQGMFDNKLANLHHELSEVRADEEEKSPESRESNGDDENAKPKEPHSKSAQIEKADNQDVDHEEEEKSPESHDNIGDYENAEPKEPHSESSQVEKADNQDVNHEQNSGISISNVHATNHANESCGFDTNLYPSLNNRTLDMKEIQAEPPFSSSGLSAKSSISSQTELVTTSTGISTNAIETKVQEGMVDDRKELKLSMNKDNEATPITGDAPTIISQEVKSNPVMKQPVGLRQTTPLPDSLSQNKERAPKPTINTPSANTTSSPTPSHPAGLGGAPPLPEATSRVAQHARVNGAISSAQNQLVTDPTSAEAEEYDETREKLQMIRVKFLRLAHRLGQTPHNVVVAQVLYRLGLAEQLHGRSGGRVANFSFDRASAMAEQLEASAQEPLDFTCTIMVLGKSGVGKSATINSIFDKVIFNTDAFDSGTKKVQDIVGAVQGIRVRVIDTPGLLPSWSDQHQNERTLCSVKKFIKKTPPDIVLYLDRLDMQSRNFGDMPLLRTITETFGASIWFNAIVVLTHAASAPPEGPNGAATSYDMFVTQRSHVIQQAIRQAAGDMRLMNPVSLVENHSDCRTNRAGQRVLPNGQVWKPHLLLLSFASKILAEANTLLKLQDTSPGRPFAARLRSSPLPFLLSSLLHSRPEIKLPSEQFGDDDDNTTVDNWDECAESDEESEYDELPPFKTLTKAQLNKLSRAQRKAYYDELEYREKLFMKKQLKEERKRRIMMKKLDETAKDLSAKDGDINEDETGGASSVSVPMPDLSLPASFDSDNPTHRYRSLESSNTWLVRAVLEPNGWDHDIGYDGINIEKLFTVKEKVPVSLSGHVSKDKKDINLQMEIASSVKHAKGKTTSLGFEMQSVGKDYAYTLRSETQFCNHRMNKAVAGLSATALGDVVTGGVKLEDKLIIGKRGHVVVSGGAIYGRGEVAYGGSLEATLKDKEHPMGRFFSTLGLSIMDFHGDVSIGCNSQTQIPIGRYTNLVGRVNINDKGSGQFSVKINSSEQLQILLIGLIPLVKKLMGYYSQQA